VDLDWNFRRCAGGGRNIRPAKGRSRPQAGFFQAASPPLLISRGMPLTLRPTKLETSPVYAHLKDYTVFEDGTEIGRMYEQRPPAPSL
jgi:hypothetical protein